MDTYTFAVELTKTVIWPVVLVGLAWRFHRHIAVLLVVSARVLLRMRKFKYGDAEMSAPEWASAAGAFAAASSEKVEVVQKELKTPGLTPEEHDRLVDELKRSAAEQASFAALAKRIASLDYPDPSPAPVVFGPPNFPAPPPRVSMNERMAAAAEERARHQVKMPP